MTPHVTTVPDGDADVRWRNWQARGVEHDRRTVKRMRGLMLLIGVGFVVWIVVQLA
jgi:hypothetical protein